MTTPESTQLISEIQYVACAYLDMRLKTNSKGIYSRLLVV